jgi:transcriptional regulator with XRE-family HTH domain
VSFRNNVGPQVRRRRHALGWSQSDRATKLQLAGFDISHSGVSKIEARLSYVDDKTLLYLAEALKVRRLLGPATNTQIRMPASPDISSIRQKDSEVPGVTRYG